MRDVIAPGSVIGILGGGQLGRMTALAAANLGYKCHIFEPDANCPASQVAPQTVAAYESEGSLLGFAAKVDVVTLEFENVPVETLKMLQHHVPVHPGANVLHAAQDRAAEKTFLNDAGIATAPWAEVRTLDELKEAVEKIGRPSVLKTARFGYDGKGQVKITDADDLEICWNNLKGARCVLEGFVKFKMEISVLAARSSRGEVAIYEPAENDHKNHILDTTTLPANICADVAAKAEEAARKAVEALDMIGLLAVEMFVTQDDEVIVNEVAPRPHNSGHWTQDACATSQFEQLVRAVCGLPLGSTERHFDVQMTNLLGHDIDAWEKILDEPNAKLHLYGKAQPRAGRKMGHVNRLIRPVPAKG